MEQRSKPAAETRHSHGYAIGMLLLLLAANTLNAADRHLFPVLMPAIKAEFGASDSILGFIAGPGFILSYVLVSLPLARLADRWSRRGVLALSVTFWSSATALCGLAGNLAQLTIARICVGVGEAGGFPPSQSIVSDLFRANRRSSAMGVLTSGTYLGVLIGMAGGAAIASLWGWQAAFIALAIPGAPIALLIWILGPRRTAATVTPLPKTEHGMLATLRKCWSIRSLRLMAIAMGVFNIFGYAAATWLPTYFMRSHDMSIVEAGLLMGIGSAGGGVAGSFASGWLVDRLGVHDPRWQLRIPALGFLIAYPLMLTMLLLPSGIEIGTGLGQVPAVVLFSVITGFLVSLWAGPSYAAAAGLAPPDHRAQATAMLITITNVIGSTMGPLTAGLVSDALTRAHGIEALRLSLLLMTSFMLIGGLLFWRASNLYPADLEHASRT